MSEALAELEESVLQTEPTLMAATPVSLGLHLSKLRSERGMTIHQVADSLKLAPSQVEALEKDNFQALPSAVIARGFLRNYAKLLKVDPLPFMQTVTAQVEPMALQTPASRAGRTALRFNRSSNGLGQFKPVLTRRLWVSQLSKKWLLAGGALLLVVWALVWTLRQAHVSVPALLGAAPVRSAQPPAQPAQTTPVQTTTGIGNTSINNGQPNGQPITSKSEPIPISVNRAPSIASPAFKSISNSEASTSVTPAAPIQINPALSTGLAITPVISDGDASRSKDLPDPRLAPPR